MLTSFDLSKLPQYIKKCIEIYKNSGFYMGLKIKGMGERFIASKKEST
jgi:hypothetical protein